ncbi:Protein OS-9 [Linnemannia gamsii]|uniref:Protein OS-9 homolog n=1 Tax=Linnemannia gamsii TaxID=64522 RepID=A0ABQ7JK56_9FUNG|nr:Protein OS-9 [Linnemannia gamsii]
MRIKKTISPTKAAILVCASIATVVLLIPQTEAFSVNFVYKDLLAHPQYDVDFLSEVVPASSVVSRSNTHRRQQRQGQAQIETAKSWTQDQQQDTIHESPSTMVMTDADGMRWSCMIPPKLVHEVKAPPQLTPQEIKEEERRSVQRGLELLDHLSQRCIWMKRDFWTYEYCHKQSIRQFHAVQSNGGQWVPQAPENTYILARYQSEESNNNQAQPNNEAALQQRSPSSTSVVKSTITTTELEVSNDRKYLVQHWESGDICEETNLPRKVEVQFQCAPFEDKIQLVHESPICNYIMVIASPNLCKDTAFEIVPTPEANKIECKGIVSDEQYQKLMANAPETIDGAARIVQDHNAQIKIGQVPRQQPYQPQTHQKKAAVATGDSQATILAIIGDPLVQSNDVDAQKILKDTVAEYEVIWENFKATLSPEVRAQYERVENLLKGNGGGLSKEEQEKEAKEYRAAVDALFGTPEETEKEPQQAKEPSTPPQHQEQKTSNAGTAANAVEGKQKQGQESVKEETKEEEKNAQVKL